MHDLHAWVNPKTGKHSPMIDDEVYKVVMDNKDILDSAIIYDRDFAYNYFGFKTLERSYLLRINGKIVERPQHMIMRVAVGIHGANIDKVIETYNLMSERYFTHASPTVSFLTDCERSIADKYGSFSMPVLPAPRCHHASS